MSSYTSTELRAGFLPPPAVEPECDDVASVDQSVVDAEADAAETVWLTAREVAEEYGVDRSTFQHAASRNDAGLHESRRATRRPGTGRRARMYETYEYPLHRIERWLNGEQGEPAPATVFSDEHDWYLDQIETEWLDVTEVMARTGRNYAKFMRGVSVNLYGLKQSRRRREGRQHAHLYANWRVQQWNGTSSITAFSLPPLAEVRAFRAAQDAAATAVALKIGFSPTEVAVAAATGDLPVERDHNTGKILFMAPTQVQSWLARDSWRQGS